MENNTKPWEIDDVVYFSRCPVDSFFSSIGFARGIVEIITRDKLHIKLYTQKDGELLCVPRSACYPTLQSLYDALHAQMDVEFDRLSQPVYEHKEE